ncbi:MAG: hypothetical protein ACE5RE_03685 [Candidatus Nitrosomaritimum aestuariumsis]
MNSTGNQNPQFELRRNLPSLNYLLIISLGLIFVAIISSTFVYAESTTVNVEGDNYDIEYTGNGVSVTGVEADLDFISLIFSVDVTNSPGTLEVTFERAFFDSVYQGSDDSFIILADGDEPSYSEIETSATSRTLSMTLPSGTDEVEIIGSVFGSGPQEPAEEPVKEEPAEEPVKEEPSEEPVKEEPVEEPVKDKPVKEDEEQPTEKPRTECGPGTVLKDGVCVLDQRCGPGTVLKDDVCVLDSTPKKSAAPQALGKELVYGFVAAFVVAGIIGIILALMGKASKSKD